MPTEARDYTASELLAVMSGRLLKDGQVVFAGVGVPLLAMKHEKRRFVKEVDFITSPGFLHGGTSRRDAGLTAGGMFRVVTDLGLFGFDETSKRMKLLALHPGVTEQQVQDNTGFELMME